MTGQVINAPEAKTKKAGNMLKRHTRNCAALVLSVMVLASCGSKQKDGFTTAEINNDYRLRHPITLAEAEHTLDVPVSASDRALLPGLGDSIRGFAQNYATSTSGVVQVAIPQGAINSTAARNLTPAIRKTLTDTGIPAKRIVTVGYQAPAGGVSAPIRLSFIAVTAMTEECGQWPEDLVQNSFENRNWYNFGCANQNNLAAQVANANDLYAPRGMTPIDAERRANVITDYRENGGRAGN